MAEHTAALADDIRPLVRILGRPPEEWQRADLVRYCLEHGVRVVNFHYPAIDGKLKELRLPVNDRTYLERILAAGERVDGSNLYHGILDPGYSDLYVVPVYRWAFINPWAADELDIVCRYADKDGAPCKQTPDNILFNAAARLRQATGLSLHALAELEFYIITQRNDDRFTGLPQRNYHQSAPYLHSRAIADEILRAVSAATSSVKYCHSEVGYIDQLGSDDPELDGHRVEQYELEFDLMPVEDLGCWLAVAKWLARCIADRHGASLTFLPKLDEGMAGSGMHLHLALYRDGENVMHAAPGELSEEALKLIGGVLRHAAPLTALGNTVAASYLRLVPNQEAPTRVCWGRHNRSSLIRVPLGFDVKHRVDQQFNLAERGEFPSQVKRPTVELRSPDGSAFTLLLLSALAMCAEDGLTSADSLAYAKGLEVQGNIFHQPELLERLASLPLTAVAAADVLEDQRAFFEERGFHQALIDRVLRKLRDEDDLGLEAKLRVLPAAERLKQSRRLMHKDVHKH